MEAGEGPCHALMQLTTFGQLLLSDEEGSEVLLRNTHSLALLAYLAAKPKHEAARGYLAGLFWPHAGASRRRRLLRQHLYYLRSNVPTPVVRTRDENVKLEQEPLKVDLWQFHSAVRSGEYAGAIRSYSGHFLETYRSKASDELKRWIETEDQSIVRTVLSMIEALVREHLDAGTPEEAVEYAWKAVRLAPLNRKTNSLLRSVLVEADQPASAYQAYEKYQLLLQTELEEEPTEHVEETLQTLRRLAARSVTGPELASQTLQDLTSPSVAPASAEEGVGLVVHRDGRVVNVNAEAAELAGADGPEQLIGRNIDEFLVGTQSEKLQRRLGQLEDGEATDPTEYQIRRLDGQQLRVRGRSMPFRAETGAQFVVSAAAAVSSDEASSQP